jgi:hypothetical protein
MAELEEWLKTKFVESIWVGGHRFKKTEMNEVEVDGTLFTDEEVKQLFRMLTSKNPLIRLYATFIIWERNGMLVKLFSIIALIMLIVVYLVVRR